MPELADVEGFRRVLAEHALGRRIVRIAVHDSQVVHGASEATLARALRGRRFEATDRHGKWLIARLAGRERDGTSLLMHFGMTGSLQWAPSNTEHRGRPGESRHPHDRVVFETDAGELRYRDMRKLEGVHLCRGPADEQALLGELGPDALAIDRAQFAARVCKRRAKLKGVLMDQSVLAGLGNELTDEVLWRARLAGHRKAAELTDPECTRLHQRMHSVLRQTVRVGYIPPRPSWLSGHRREAEPACPRCGTGLRQDRITGRATLWCPHCQR